MCVPFCNLQGSFKFFFAYSSPLKFWKEARRLARGRRWHTQEEENFPKFPSGGIAAARDEGWMVSFPVHPFNIHQPSAQSRLQAWPSVSAG